MTVGAVVVAYQTSAAELSACLRSLQANDLTNIVVVDNSPSPALARIAQQALAQYLPQATNSGFATAANCGANQLASDLIVFLNPDAELETGAIAQASHYAAGDRQCGIVGFVLVSPAGRPELESFGTLVTPLTLFSRRFIPRRVPTQPQRVGWTSGGALLVRRTTFTALRGFDPGFFLYWEDIDLCRRALQSGWHTVLLPRPGAIHRRGASLNNSRDKARLYDQSADKYFRKHYAKAICLPLHYLRRAWRLLLPQAG